MSADETQDLRQEILDVAEKARGEAVKKLETAANKLRRQVKDAGDDVQEQAQVLIQNLEATAHVLSERALDRFDSFGDIVGEQADRASASVVRSARRALDTADHVYEGVFEDVIEDNTALTLLLAFLGGVTVGLLLGRR
jgi:DNA anti-recombination protein RmuC